MQILTYDDITGDGASHQLISLLKIGGVLQVQKNWDSKWFQCIMTTAAGLSRIGPSTISATNGIQMGGSNGNQFAPVYSQPSEKYELDQLYVIIAAGDVMSVARAA